MRCAIKCKNKVKNEEVSVSDLDIAEFTEVLCRDIMNCGYDPWRDFNQGSIMAV